MSEDPEYSESSELVQDVLAELIEEAGERRKELAERELLSPNRAIEGFEAYREAVPEKLLECIETRVEENFEDTEQALNNVFKYLSGDKTLDESPIGFGEDGDGNVEEWATVLAYESVRGAPHVELNTSNPYNILQVALGYGEDRAEDVKQGLEEIIEEDYGTDL